MISNKALTIIAIVQFTSLAGIVQGWKPIPGPPTAFSITQSHPAVGASVHAHNTIVEAAGGSTGIEQPVISYRGRGRASSSVTTFLDDQPQSHESVLIEDDPFTGYDYSDPSGDSGDDSKVEARLFGHAFSEDVCSVDKYAFEHEGTVQYQHKMPKLDQFTLCMWMRFTNHSADHTMFTYAVDDEPREIQMWISNSRGSSYISMAIHGQQVYRLNYPLKMRVWHHACSSWNGKTGEWQLWMKAERVGRGFHNRLVDFVIRPHGITYSGGPSKTGPTTQGLHSELTLVQLYKVALSAGKAHRDHKHHHVHHFNHDGVETTTTPQPPPQPQLIQPGNPLLANGQIPSRLRINLAGPENNVQNSLPIPQQPQGAAQGLPSQLVGGILPGAQPSQASLTTNFVNGQYSSAGRFISQQLLSSLLPQRSPSTIQFPGSLSSQSQQVRPSFSQFENPANVQFIDSDLNGSRFIFKRDSEPKEKTVTKRAAKKKDKKIVNKRGLIMLDNGSVIDDELLAHGYQFEGLAQFGLPAFKENLQKHMDIEDEIREHDMEPAEDEVRAVMQLCTSCEVEPFKGALVMAWKNLRVTQDHVLKGRSVGGCGYF